MTWGDLQPGKYLTITVDPPWLYPTTGEGRSRRGVNPGKSDEGYLKPDLAYSGMSLKEMKELPVADLAEKDGARLFLWVTNRYLRHAWEVVEAWGFKPMDRVLVWCKTPRCTTPVTTEFILPAKIGHPPRMPWHTTTWFDWGHTPGHSMKPPAFADLVESWCPGPYAELFARQQRMGWDSWGGGDL